MKTRDLSAAAVVAAVLVTVGCESAPPPTWDLGDPLPGLTESELARFEAGKAAFSRIYTPEEGLGPVYNENTCNACHSHPIIGGSGGVELDVHATRWTEGGACDLLGEHGGGNIRTRVTAQAAAAGLKPERTPAQATERGVFTALPMWGRGLVEAISDRTLLALEDPDDRNEDWISGRVGRDASGAVGRFRRKADVADLAAIAEGGVRAELGLTTPAHPEEEVFGDQVVPPGADPAPDPEVDQATLDAIADFIRFLAPAPRVLPDDPQALRQIEIGEQAFHDVGCAACHVPTLRTGSNEVAALSRVEAPLYSDLLLHDMGPELADVCSPAASPSEVRTEILNGVSYRTVYMHDGRAPTLWEAIALHGGEGAPSRAAFDDLPEAVRHAVVAFLGTL